MLIRGFGLLAHRKKERGATNNRQQYRRKNEKTASVLWGLRSNCLRHHGNGFSLSGLVVTATLPSMQFHVLMPSQDPFHSPTRPSRSMA
jgi:hypothetical protein